MRLAFCFLCTLFLMNSKSFAQEMLTESFRDEFRSTMLEHIELKHQELVLELDSIKQNSKFATPITEQDIEIFRRFKTISQTIPLEYNDEVKFYIDKYISQNYRPYMNRLLGLSNHYFPIYEAILKESGIPEEVKYLSLVESSLNPHLVSTSGAVGPWQFMYTTAKEYSLDMNSNVDERKDAYSSSYAVSQYFKESYRQFGDWLLVLASYNCGRGCVQRAILKSGMNQPTFWELSPFLPQETRNYIPKYIAMTYVLSDAAYYDIKPETTELDLDHKILLIDKGIDLAAVAKAIGLSIDNLKKYNPAFKHNLVNGTQDKPKRLLLPITDALNDSLLYLALNDPKTILGNDQIDGFSNASFANGGKYKVKRGETLAVVSGKFGVSIQNLKAWNGLSAHSAIVGKTLIVEKPIDEKLATNVKSAVANKKRNNMLVYTVKKGDSLDRIANKHAGVTVSTLKADNGLKSNIIKPGMKLKINKGNG